MTVAKLSGRVHGPRELTWNFPTLSTDTEMHLARRIIFSFVPYFRGNLLALRVSCQRMSVF